MENRFSNNNKKYTGNAKPEKYSKDTFTKDLINKTITVIFTDDKYVIGKILEVGMYDIKLKEEGLKEITIIMKSAIKMVRLIE